MVDSIYLESLHLQHTTGCLTYNSGSQMSDVHLLSDIRGREINRYFNSFIF